MDTAESIAVMLNANMINIQNAIGCFVSWKPGFDPNESGGDWCGSDGSVRVDSEVPSAWSTRRVANRVCGPRVGTVMATGVTPTCCLL